MKNYRTEFSTSILENEYNNHHRLNEEERHVVQNDIRIAKQIQSEEEDDARRRGVRTKAGTKGQT